MEQKKWNVAQQLRHALGIDVVELDSFPRNPSSTKSGPGRRHVAGQQKDSPIKRRGAPAVFTQHYSPLRRKQRAMLKRLGRRQFLKLKKGGRLLARQRGVAQL